MNDESNTAGPAAGEAIVVAPQNTDEQTIVGTPDYKLPPPVAAEGEVLLAVEGPWTVAEFDPSIEGCPVITKGGTSVAPEFVDQAISIGAANGVSIVKR